MTLFVLLLSVSVGVVAADNGGNLFTDPNFQSIGTGSGTTWKVSYTGSGTVSGSAITGGAELDLYPSAFSTVYGYVATNSKINLAYTSSISLTTTRLDYNGASINDVDAYYSSNGNTWNILTKTGGSKLGTLTWDTSSLTGSYYVRFGVSVTSTTSDTSYYKLKISGASAIDSSSPPVFSSATSLNSPIEIGSSTTTTVTYTAGVPAAMTVSVDWGDGNTDTKSSGQSFTHTYNSAGYFDVTCTASNTAFTTSSHTIGVVAVTPKITSVTTSGATFSGGIAAVTPGTTVYFLANYNGEISSGNAFTWSIGGNEVQGTQDYAYTFNTAGTYQVKVKVAGATGTSSYYTVGTVSVGTNSITLSGTGTYTAGDTATISWTLNNPDYSQNYNLQIFSSDSSGITSGNSVITPYSISSASVTSYQWSTSGSSGYYIAKIYKGTTEIASSSLITVQTIASLTVSLTASAVTWTNSTTVTMYKDGAQYAQQTTTTGQVVFQNVVSGTYTVMAETIGYSSQSATVQLAGTALSINIDFVNGASTQDIGGAGSMYSVTYVTFRVIDKNTGATVPGAKISGSAVEATNPIEWIVNWFGGAFGNKVIGTNISGYSDDNGVVSFVMYPNLRYSLKLEHTGLSSPNTRTFSPSSLNAEYPWYIEFPQQEIGTTKNIKVTVNVTDTGLVSAHYKDLSLTTSTVNLNVYSKDDNGNYNVSMGSSSGGGNDIDLEPIQLTGYSGKDIKVVVTSQTAAYGTVTKVYYHTFIGPWLNLGLPNDIYIWICLLTAILLGGVATFLNSYTTCFVICFFEWMYWFFGWFFQIGQLVALPLLIFATVISVIFYMQSRK